MAHSAARPAASAKNKLLLWVVAIGFFMPMLDGTILNTSLPRIAADFGVTSLKLYVVVLAYLITVAFVIPISGWLADTLGLRKAFMLALILFTAGSVCCALSFNVWQLVGARVLQGVGGALLVPIGRLALTMTFPKKDFVYAISFVTIPGLIGPLIGPSLGGVIVQFFSWHWIFLINVPLGFLCLIMANYAMADFKPVKHVFDWKGYIFFSMGVLTLSLSAARGTAWVPYGALMFAASILFFYCYIRSALQRPLRALFKPRLFYNRSFSVGITANMFLRMSGGVMAFLAPLMMQTAMGFSPVKAGLTMLPFSLSTIFAKTIVERVLNTFGYRRFMAYNTAIMGVLLCGFSFLSEDVPYYFILLFFGVYGIFNSMHFTSLNTLTLVEVPRRDMSQANGLLSVVTQLSTSVGIGLAAASLAFFKRDYFASLNMGVLDSFHITFLLMGIFTAAGAMLFVLPVSEGIAGKPKHMEG